MAESKMTVIYALMASAVVMLVFAGLIWTRALDIGFEDPMPLAALLVVGAVMDVVVAAIFLRRLSH